MERCAPPLPLTTCSRPAGPGALRVGQLVLPSPAATLERAGPELHLGSIIELTLLTGHGGASPENMRVGDLVLTPLAAMWWHGQGKDAPITTYNGGESCPGGRGMKAGELALPPHH